MAIEVKKVSNSKEHSAFLKLPWKIYENDPTWAPDLIMDLEDRLNRKKHPFFKQGSAEFFLAYKDGEVVGRIAAIDNPDHNKYWKEKTGFWGFFECINDQAVANALFDAAKDWVKAKGMTNFRGPMSCSTNDEVGMQYETDGSHRMPIMPYNPLYYMDLCKNYGMKKAKDLVAFKLDMSIDINPKVLRIAEHIKKKAAEKGLVIRNLNTKKKKEEFRKIIDVYEAGWAENWGFVPMSQAEFDMMAETLLLISDPKLVVIIEKDNEVVGFATAIFDLMEITHSLRKYHKWPLWLQSILQLLKLVWKKFIKPYPKFKRARLLLAGVKPNYRQLGFDALLYTLPFMAGKAMGIETGELSWELEDNTAIISGIEKMGGKVYKKNRVWDMDVK